jgi:hypothetical protein
MFLELLGAYGVIDLFRKEVYMTMSITHAHLGYIIFLEEGKTPKVLATI